MMLRANSTIGAAGNVVVLVSGLLWSTCGLAAETSPLNIQIVKGNGAYNNAISMTSGTTIVRVISTGGQAVPDALVVFTAPSSGASVDFGGDGHIAQSITDESGIAVAPHIRAIGGNGPLEIKVFATSKGFTAFASLCQMNLGLKDGTAAPDAMEITVVSNSVARSPLNSKSTLSRSIRLRVSNESGQPVTGAAIRCQERKSASAGHRSEDVILLEGVTDSSGEFASVITYRNDHSPLELLVKATRNGISSTRYISMDR